MTQRALLLILLSVAALLSSCVTPAVGVADVFDPKTSASIGFLRTDGDTIVARGKVGASIALRLKGDPPIYLAGPVTVQGGKTLVASKSHHYREELSDSDPLPSWVRDSGLFTSEEIEAFGLTFAP